MEPVKARDAIHPVRVPPKPLGIAFSVTLPSVNEVWVPVVHDKYLVLSVPVALTHIPMGWLAGSAIMAPEKGTAAKLVLPALVAVADRPNTQPFAVDMLGAVCPVARTPPNRYQISTGPVVPDAAEKMLDSPVRNMG